MYVSRRVALVTALLFLCCSCTGCRLWPFGGKKFVEKGTGCYYSDEYQGKRTASGEDYNARAFTAAHKKLPFGTIVKVKNLRNGKTVKVRINDRGPFKRGRIIDLSKAAAREIGLLQAGIAPVRIEVLKWGPR